MKLDGKTAIITGAGSGLGKAIARRYAEEGANLLIADIDLAAAEVVAGELSERGFSAVAQRTDVSDEASVLAMVDAAIGAFGAIDILVANAGITTLRPFLELPVAEWDRVMAVNLRGVFLCGQAVGRHMADRRSGSIINVSSIEQDFGSENRAHYVASKAGVATLTKSMAVSLTQYNIRVNAIAPGSFNTEIFEKAFPDIEVRKEFIAGITKKNPMKRLGDPKEIGGAAVFLASDDSSYVNASIIHVNGGAAAPMPSDP